MDNNFGKRLGKDCVHSISVSDVGDVELDARGRFQILNYVSLERAQVQSNEFSGAAQRKLVADFGSDRTGRAGDEHPGAFHILRNGVERDFIEQSARPRHLVGLSDIDHVSIFRSCFSTAVLHDAKVFLDSGR